VRAPLSDRFAPITSAIGFPELRPRELLVGTVGARWTAYFD
jgi:hypothetical protein